MKLSMSCRIELIIAFEILNAWQKHIGRRGVEGVSSPPPPPLLPSPAIHVCILLVVVLIFKCFKAGSLGLCFGVSWIRPCLPVYSCWRL